MGSTGQQVLIALSVVHTCMVTEGALVVRDPIVDENLIEAWVILTKLVSLVSCFMHTVHPTLSVTRIFSLKNAHKWRATQSPSKEIDKGGCGFVQGFCTRLCSILQREEDLLRVVDSTTIEMGRCSSACSKSEFNDWCWKKAMRVETRQGEAMQKRFQGQSLAHCYQVPLPLPLPPSRGTQPPRQISLTLIWSAHSTRASSVCPPNPAAAQQVSRPSPFLIRVCS